MFKVGDKVRILDTKNIREKWYPEYIGKVGLITKIPNLESDFYFLDGNKYGTNFLESDLQLVEDKMSTTVETPKREVPPKQIIPHISVCDGDTRCDKCRRLGCNGCIHCEGGKSTTDENLGLCAVCAGDYKANEVDIHKVPTAKQLKSIPAIVMPPPKYKVGQKICVIKEYEIKSDGDFAAKQAVLLGAKNWVKGNLTTAMSIGHILATKLHINIPRKGYIYLIRMDDYPNREVLVAEAGLSNESKYVNFKFLCVGQLVQIKTDLKTPIWHNPGGIDAFTKQSSQVFRVIEKRKDIRCYVLNDMHKTLCSYEWLEPLTPILRKDKPIIEKKLSIKDPVKRIMYNLWINQAWRNRGGSIKERGFVLNYCHGSHGTTLKECLFSKDLFNELDVLHRGFIERCGIVSGSANSSQGKPLVFILGERKGVCSIAIPILNNFQEPGGCGVMPTIKKEEFSSVCGDLIAMKYSPCGVARLGAFDVNSTSLAELAAYKDMYMLSIGRNGIAVQSGAKADMHNYKVV